MCCIFCRSEQILTLTGQLFNWHNNIKKTNLSSKFPCAKVGATKNVKKLTSAKEIVCDYTNAILILTDKLMTPMSKVVFV